MSAEPLILVVDGDAGSRRLVKLELSSQGFRVIGASDGAEGLRLAQHDSPDLVILSVLMEGITGLAVLASLRKRNNVPVLLLTAKNQAADIARCLDLGADDCIVTPFNPNELSARVRAILRRTRGSDDVLPNVVTVSKVEIDLDRRLVKSEGVVVPLTRTEWMLLQHLAVNQGRTVLNRELLTKVWGPEFQDQLPSLRVWVSRLRSKLEADPSSPTLIKTLPGIGYQIGVECDSSQNQELDRSFSSTPA